jgi:hypothetical protein
MLVVESPAIAALALNATPLPTPPPGSARWTHDITPLLTDRNELVLEPATADGGPWAKNVDGNGRVALPHSHGRITLEILTPPGVSQ